MPSAADARAGGAYVQLYTSGEKVVFATLKAIGDGLKKVATTTAIVGAALAAGAALITAPMVHGVHVASEWASEIVRANRATGISFENLSSLAYGLNANLDELAIAVRTMDGQLDQAINQPAGEAAQRINAMGLSIDQLARMSQDERIRTFADALSRIGDEGQRVANMRALFGRGGAALNINGGREGLRQREQRGRDVGAVMSAEDVQTMSAYNIAFREFTTALRGLSSTIGVAIAPILTEWFELITNVIVQVRRLVDNNRPLVNIIFQVADAIGIAALAIGGIASLFYGAGLAVAFLTPMILFFKAVLLGVVGVVSFLFATPAGWAIIAAAIVAVTIYAVGLRRSFEWLATVYELGRSTFLRLWQQALVALEPVISVLRQVRVAMVEVGKVALDILAPVFGAITRGLEGTLGAVAMIPGRLASIGSAAGEAAAVTMTAFQTAFDGVSAAGMNAFHAIRDAWRAGDLTMVWNIVKVAAEIAWLEITRFVMTTWIGWKYAFLSMWAELQSVVVEIFHSVWTDAQVAYENFLDALDQGWSNMWVDAAAFLGNVFLRVTAVIIRAWARVHSAIIQSVIDIARELSGILGGLVLERLGINANVGSASAAGLNTTANEADAGANAGEHRRAQGAGADAVRQRAAQEARDREAARERERQRRELERQRDLAEAQGAPAGRLAELNAQLAQLQEQAARAAEEAERRRRNRVDERGRGDGDGMERTGGAGRVMGTFSAAAALGFGGGGVQEQQLAVQQQLLDVARRQLDALNPALAAPPGALAGPQAVMANAAARSASSDMPAVLAAIGITNAWLEAISTNTEILARRGGGAVFE